MIKDTELLKQKEVAAGELRHTVDPTAFQFETTAEVEPLKGTIGQERALEAIETGLSMEAPGFNIFATGQVGTGRNSALEAMVQERARREPAPSDWCYVYNFEHPDEPNALELPAGQGRELRSDMEELIEQCQEEIPKAFEAEEYEKQRTDALQDLQQKRNELISELREKARELDYAIQVTPAGIAAAPIVDDKTLSQEEFEELSEEKQQELREKHDKVQELIAETVSEARQLEKQMRERAREVDKQVGLWAVGHLVDRMIDKYDGYEEVVSYLKAVKENIIENIGLFRSNQDGDQDPMGLQRVMRRQAYTKYKVNVVVDNSESEGAPYVDERNPTFYNLFGEIEYRSQLGGMTTDFTMVKAGSFLEANGGYIKLQVLDVLRNPFAWEALKRAIRTGQVRIENMWEQYRPVPAATISPEPIPVDVKVLLVGNPWLYHLLYMLDEDFRRLFKIKAAFDVEMDFDAEHLDAYGKFVSNQCEKIGLPDFERGAAARVAEYGIRLAGHQERLSTRFQEVANLIAEAGHLSGQDNGGPVKKEHVQKAIEARERRSRLVQDKIQRMIEEDTLLIDTEAAEPGQINGLSVLEMGDYRFSKPTRITCVSSIGQEGVVNIERESKMSGNIHNKGVLILSGYLEGLFGHNKPLSLSARLCFEQSYSEVEGDSASCTELFALLSTMAGLPLRQDIAVTGSINQKGQVQPIGAVNEKIEGFYEVCKQRGLNGEQGVLIPARNTRDLMLKEEVVQAARDGQFHVYAVETVKEGIEIMTGMPAGERDEEGNYPEETVYGRVDRRMQQIAEVLKEYGRAGERGREGEEE